MGGTLFRLLVPVAAATALTLGGGLPAAWAQGDGKKDAGDKGDKDQEWTDLQVEEDEPEPETAPPPPPPPPPGAGGSQYRAEPSKPPPEPPPPKKPPADDEDAGGSRTFMRYWEPQFAWRSIRAEFDVWSTEDFNCYTWDVVARLGVENFPAYFDVDIPWTYVVEVGGDAGDDDLDQLQFGNPTFGGHGGGKVADIVGIWGGMTVSVPTTAVDDSDDDGQGDEFFALFVAARARALVEAHRFWALHVPLRFQVGVEVQIHPYIYARAELSPIIYIPTEDAEDVADLVGYDALSTVMDQIYEVEALSPIGLGGGVRFQVSTELNEGLRDWLYDGDTTQTALEPYITYSPPFRGPFEVPVFARVGLLFALDEPLGFGFDERDAPQDGTAIWKVATVRTQVGARY